MLRIVAVVFGVLLASALIVLAIERMLAKEFVTQIATGGLRERFRPLFIMIEEQIEPVPAHEREARFSQLTSRFNYPVRLVEREAAIRKFQLSDSNQQLLRSDRILVFDDQLPAMLIKQLGNTDLVIELELPSLKQPFYLKMYFYYALQGLLMLVAVSWLGHRFWRDVGRIKHATQRISEGIFDARIKLPAHSLLAPLGDDVNQMAERLEHLMKSHRDLVSAVSHEIRHPLTRMLFHHQLAEGSVDRKDMEVQLANLGRDIAELEELTDEILIYARMKRTDADESPMIVPTERWVGAALESTREVLEMEGRSIRLVVDIRSVQTQVIEHLMQRAATNLLRNAVRHARSLVAIRVYQKSDVQILEVIDDGPGVATGDRERIFEPFVRLDSARDRSSGSYGMGLAIVRRAAHLHNGVVEYVDRANSSQIPAADPKAQSDEASQANGACFRLSWPVDPINGPNPGLSTEKELT